MSSAFRIDESQFRAWHAAVAERHTIRGAASVAKEMEAHLMRVADGHVAVGRHQLFTWAEALDGASARDPRAASAGTQLSLPQVVADMRAVLGGRSAAASQGPGPGPAWGQGMGAGAGGSAPVPYLTPTPTYAPPSPAWGSAPVASPMPSGESGAVRFVAGHELPDVARRLVREAQSELMIVAPWQTGLETLVADLVALRPDVRVRLLGRPPAQADAAYHRGIAELGRRGVVTTFSPHLYTRMIVQDRRAALVGAAGAAASREGALLTTDTQAVIAAAAHFERLVAEVGSR